MVIAESLRYFSIFTGRDKIESKWLIKLGLADAIPEMEENRGSSMISRYELLTVQHFSR